MDSTVEREHDKSAEDVNDAAVENSEPQLDESAKDVNDEIKYKYPVVKEIPEGLVAQMKENADLVAKFYAAFEGDWIPEALEVWVYFNLYCLRMPEHRNVRFDVFDGSYTYLLPFYPKFRLDAKKNTRIGVANTGSLLMHSYSIMKVALVMKTSYTRN